MDAAAPTFPLRLDQPGPVPGEVEPLAFACAADLEGYRAAQGTYTQCRARVLSLGGGGFDLQCLHRAAFPAFNEAGEALERLTRKARRLRRDLDGIPHPTPLRDSLAAP